MKKQIPNIVGLTDTGPGTILDSDLIVISNTNTLEKKTMTDLAKYLQLYQADSIQLSPYSSIAGHTEGRVYYDKVWKTLAVDIDTDVSLQVGQEDLRLCWNATGATLYNGEAVYTNGVYSGGTNDVATIALANAAAFATSQSLGVCAQDIPDSSYGFVCVRGHVNDIDTNEIGRSFLQTQDMFFSARVGGIAGNAYSLTIVQTGGSLSYTEVTPGVIELDLGAGSPTTDDIVTYMMVTSPSTNVKVKATATSIPIAASILSFANGVDTLVGDVLYLSAADSGFLTTVPPSAPSLKLRMGRIITKDATAGRINVRILNYGRLQDLSDVAMTGAVDGDIIVYDAATSSWKNVPNTLPTYDLISEIKVLNGIQDIVVICNETSTMYRYVADGITPIDYGAPDDQYITITGDGGITRWVGISGVYCYNQKNSTFITNKLIAGHDDAYVTISGATTLDSTVGSQIILDVTGADQEVTLPAAVDSIYSQHLLINVAGTSAYSAIFRTTNTHIDSDYLMSPGEGAYFVFGKQKWRLIGGKKAITQLAVEGIPTYKTTQDWMNVIQSSGIITGGICTDDGIGGVDISVLKAITKVSDSDIGGNVFVDVAGTNIPAGAHPNGLADGTNIIYLENGGSPVYQVTDDRVNLNRTTQFVVANVYKDGDGLEIVNLESGISNFSRKVVDRLIEVNGVNRVSGALVSEIGTRSIQTTNGVMYYGLERIVTPGMDTSAADSFDVFIRDGSGGWNEIEGESVIDRLRFDDNDVPVAVGSGIDVIEQYWMFVDNAAAVDLTGGVVEIPCTGHPFHKGDTVVLSGTTNYDGTYTLLACGVNSFNITHSYTAEMLDGDEVVTGLMKATTNAVHGLVTDDYVKIAGTTVADGSWKISVLSTTEFTLNGSIYTAPFSGGTVENLPLVALAGGGTYGVHWVFVCTEGEIYVIYGQSDYASVSDAQMATLPASLPPYIHFNTVFAAKIIVEPATAALYQIISAYTVATGTTIPTVHNDLAGIDAGDIKHVTAAEKAAIAGVGAIATGSLYNIAQYSASPTGKTIAGRVLHGATYDCGIVVDPQTLSANRTYTVDDVGANASFLMSEGDKTINGVKYFTAGVKTPFIYPNADGTTAFTFRKADGVTSVVGIDTTNDVLNIIGVGASTIVSLANTQINGWDTLNDYIQNNIQNLSNGANASTDYVATADNGSDSTHYINFGINGSGFTGGTYFPGGWHINGANDGYLYTSDGELAIGTANATPKAIRFFTGGVLAANQKGIITGAGDWSNGAHTPTAGFHLKAGSATAGKAPFKMTSGPLLSAAEAATMEYNGENFFSTIDTTHGRGLIPSETSFKLTSNGGAINSQSSFFGAGATNIPLVTNGIYQIEVVLWFSKSTSSAVTIALSLNNNPTNMNVVSQLTPTSGIVANPGSNTMLHGQTHGINAVTSYSLTTGSLSNGAKHYARFTVDLINGISPVLKVQITPSSGTVTPLTGSMWTCKRLPTNNVSNYLS